MALNNKLKTVISGEQMPDAKSKLNIITADYNYKITGASLFSLFGELKDCVISQQELEELSKSTNNSRYALHNFMKTRYPFLVTKKKEYPDRCLYYRRRTDDLS